MPESNSEETQQQQLLRQLQDALKITEKAKTSIKDVATITHSCAAGHEITDEMLQQTTAAERCLSTCESHINNAIAIIYDSLAESPMKHLNNEDSN